MYSITLTSDQLYRLRMAVLNEMERQQDAQREFGGTELSALADSAAQTEVELQAINAILREVNA